MLDKHFAFQTDESHYRLSMKRDHDWETSKRRVLIIQQTVAGLDLHNGTLASTPALVNAINYAVKHARKYEPKLPHYSFATVNWNARRHLHLKSQARADAEAEFKVRMQKLIKKLNPTHILFSGDVSLLYPIKHASMKNGWVHEIDGRKVTSTVDFARLLEKNGALANLLGFWCRHLANLLIGYLPHNIGHVKAKPVLIDTIQKFDKMIKLFDESKLAALDSETKNLSVNHNAIYTIQFAFDQKPTTGFVLPIDHPHSDNPFSQEERNYIKRELRARLSKETGPELITFNGMFDLRIVRACLRIDIIYLKVWECMAGEHLLDENISSLPGLGILAGNLAAVYCSYGNDFYYAEDTTFSKADRNTTGSIPPQDPGFLKYGATDVVSILHIRQCQIDRSAYQDFQDGKSYQPFFVRHMLFQMGDTAHQLSHLKQTGSLINKRYLRRLMEPDSVLYKAIKELGEEFKTFPEVNKANEELLSQTGFKAGSLFGGSVKKWMFSFTKSAHKIKLFIEICGLKAVSETSTGQPAIDKEFIEHYKNRSFLVEKFGEFQAATKLMSTYVKGWYKQLTREVDGAEDSHLRADYGFFNVDSGRLNSGKPNLQNIPARGKLSKIIKEMFITKDGHLLIRFDYSAHEVRGWSIVSGDMVLASAFRIGQQLRQLYIKFRSPAVHAEIKKRDWKFPLTDEQRATVESELKRGANQVLSDVLKADEVTKDLKKKGDLHIQNCYRFFGKWVEKSDPLRDAVKAVVFGVLYGKSAATLGNDTKKTELDVIKAKMSEAYKAKDTVTLKKLEREFSKLLMEDRSESAQQVIDKMFHEFPKGKAWVERMQKMATTKFYVYSPIGRIRHLYAAMTEDRQIVSRQVRRGMNAPIQGFASEIAVKASRGVMVSYYKKLGPLKNLLSIKGRFTIFFNRIVHDALYFTVPFEMVIPFIHILQYEATYGVTRDYEKQFGLKFTVEPEIELEIGSKDTNSEKWDWSLPNLISIIEQSVDAGIKDGIFTESKEEILKKIYAPWRNKEVLTMLNQEFPLLGVDLKREIYALARNMH